MIEVDCFLFLFLLKQTGNLGGNRWPIYVPTLHSVCLSIDIMSSMWVESNEVLDYLKQDLR